ncbi:MAG: hypothetical protein E7571_04895 [Ruminococcaceae bacterium]|nr:hypothetical protein [Oscillospiraceae bacterium]
MKKSKKIFSLLCAAVAVLMMCVPFASMAAVRTGEGEATLLQEGEYDIATGESVHLGAVSSTADTVSENVHQGLLAYSSRIDVSTLSCPVEDFDAFYSNVINDNPDLFFVSSSYRYYYSERTGNVTAVVPQYAMPQSEVESALEVFYAGADKALAEVNDSMSDLQKALVIHDYICSYAVYPQIYDANGNYVASLDLDIYHSAYGFFKDNTAVCAGYTLTYSYLMHRLGIDCEYVSSGDMEHSWNKVKIDGEWYNVDITYDNADYVEGDNTYGLGYHSCFMKSDSYFQSESGLYHYNYADYDAGTADSTAYDDSFWNDVNSRIYILNGDFYYLDPDYSNQSVLLKKHTLSGSETVIGSSFRAPTLSITRFANDSSGTQHQIPHTDILVRLLYLDGRFYVTDYQNLYSVYTSGAKFTIASGIGYTISLGSVDGSIVYQTYNDMSTVVKLDKNEYFKNRLAAEADDSDYNNYPDVNSDGFINGRDLAYIINS